MSTRKFSLQREDGSYILIFLDGVEMSSAEVPDSKSLQSAELYTLLVENCASAMIAVDLQGHIIAWNKAAERLYGYTAEEIMGESGERLVPEEYRRERDYIIQSLNDGRESVRGKTTRVTKFGNTIHIDYSARKMFNANGKCLGIVTTINDDTELNTARRIIESDEQRFLTVIDAAPTGIIVTDATGKIALCNSEVERLFGYPKGELLGRGIETLVPLRFREAHVGFRKSFGEAPQSRQMGAGRDLYARRSDGSEFPVVIGLNPLMREDGLYTIASIVDVTERKHFENTLKDINERLQSKNAELEQFVYTISHDLKSPIVTSASFLEFLREDFAAGKKDEVEDSLSRLVKANKRMRDLINDLLQVSRIGRVDVHMAPVNLLNVVDEVLDSLREQLEGSQIVVNIAKESADFIGDKTKVARAIENIVTNALKYGRSRDGSLFLKISSERGSENLRVLFKDSGAGIPKKDHSRIFELFQRLDVEKEGTGVGLAIVSRVMRMHRGKAWVESEVGEGATFVLSFPLTKLDLGAQDD